jgi:hypothetical protein
MGKHVGYKLPVKPMLDDIPGVQRQITGKRGIDPLHDVNQYVDTDKIQRRVVIPVPEGFADSIHRVTIRSLPGLVKIC